MAASSSSSAVPSLYDDGCCGCRSARGASAGPAAEEAGRLRAVERHPRSSPSTSRGEPSSRKGCGKCRLKKDHVRAPWRLRHSLAGALPESGGAALLSASLVDGDKGEAPSAAVGIDERQPAAVVTAQESSPATEGQAGIKASHAAPEPELDDTGRIRSRRGARELAMYGTVLREVSIGLD